MRGGGLISQMGDISSLCETGCWSEFWYVVYCFTEHACMALGVGGEFYFKIEGVGTFDMPYVSSAVCRCHNGSKLWIIWNWEYTSFSPNTPGLGLADCPASNALYNQRVCYSV